MTEARTVDPLTDCKGMFGHHSADTVTVYWGTPEPARACGRHYTYERTAVTERAAQRWARGTNDSNDDKENDR